MSIIKYTVKFKRILMIAVQEKGKMGQMRVGEVENFQQNLDGSLDIVAYIWPQVPERVKKDIEKNPSIMGMTAETIPITDALIFPDGTMFDEVEDNTEINKLRDRVQYLEKRLIKYFDDIGENL